MTATAAARVKKEPLSGKCTGGCDKVAAYTDITETVRQPFIILDGTLRVVTANMAFYRAFKVAKKDTEGRHIYELGNSQWDSAELRRLLEHILPAHARLNNYQVTHDFPGLGHKTMLLNARQVTSKRAFILLSIEDITLQRSQSQPAPHPHTAPLDKVSCDVVEQMKIAIQGRKISFKNRGQSIVLRKSDKAALAFMDPLLMFMVLGNVLDDAGKYSTGGGQVTVIVRRATADTVISVQYTPAKLYKYNPLKLFRPWHIFLFRSRLYPHPTAHIRNNLQWTHDILAIHGGSVEVISRLHQDWTCIVKTPVINAGYLSQQIAANSRCLAPGSPLHGQQYGY